jgi:hypothetical protein
MDDSLFIGTPCYRGDPEAASHWAENILLDLGQDPGFHRVLYGCANVAVARDELVRSFRNSGKELFLFRDDDVFVDSSVVQRMIFANADVIVAPYRIRDEPDRWDTILLDDGSGDVESAGLGCCLIREYVIDRLWKSYSSSLGYVRIDKFGRRDLVHLFSDFFAVHSDGTALVQEDRAFFYRVRESGFTIRVLRGAPVTHAGVLDRFE